MSEEGNRYTNAIRFMQNGQLLYLQPPAYNDAAFDFSRRVELGKAHFDENDKLVNAPMDFTRHNNIPLEDLTKMLIAVLFPESVPASNRFRLHNSDYSFLYQYMSEYPKESSFPRYDSLVYFDAYCKFFLFKSGRVKIPDYIRIFNKPGWAYGFLTDVAYIADFKHNIEFMLSAVIYVNSDGVLNDDKYDYDETGYPFFREIGETIYRFEQERKRNCTPDLKKFKLHYN
jgi:hypothetical protein